MDDASLFLELKKLAHDTQLLLLQEKMDSCFFVTEQQAQTVLQFSYTTTPSPAPALQQKPRIPTPPVSIAPPIVPKKTVPPAEKLPQPLPSAAPLPKNQTPLKAPPSPPITSFRESKQPIEETDDRDLHQLLAKIAPEIRLYPSCPSDKEAKRIAQNWKIKNTAAPITIIMNNETSSEKKFLFNLAKAIHAHFDECRVVEIKEMQEGDLWSHLSHTRLLIAQDTTIWGQSVLRKLYHAIPNKSEHFIENTPLFLMPALSLYLREPSLKKSLWQALSQKVLSLKKEDPET